MLLTLLYLAPAILKHLFIHQLQAEFAGKYKKYFQQSLKVLFILMLSELIQSITV